MTRLTAASPGIDDATAVDLLYEMVQIRSESGSEAALARHLVRRMTELGFRARLDAAGNALGELGDPHHPTLMLLGHLDTVQDGPPVRRHGDLLYGRGTVDAKGPLAAMVAAAARAGQHRGLHLVVVGAVDEERDSVGAHQLLAEHHPQAVVIGEPSGVGTVVVGYKGVLRLAYEVTRPQAHTSGPDPTACEVAARFWTAVLGLAADHPGGQREFDQLCPTLVEMNGGAQQARLVVSCRTPLGFDAPAFLADLHQIADGGVVTVLEQTPAIRSSRADPVARALARSVRAHTGEITFKVKLGTSDMNVVGPVWQVPIATYGPGDSRLDHTAQEHIDLREYLLAVRVLTDAIARLAVDLNRRP